MGGDQQTLQFHDAPKVTLWTIYSVAEVHA